MADKKRSDAAKKGWITRRKNAAKKQAEQAKAAKKTTVKTKDIGPATKKTVKKTAPDLPKAKVTKWFDDKSMCEIYSTGLQFAFVSKDWEQCHQFCYCKDFLQDAVWAELHHKSASIYGFSHKHGVNPPVDLNRARIAVRYKGKKGIKKLCKQSLSFLNAMEKEMGFEPSRMYFGGKYKNTPSSVFVFEGDKKWIHSPTLLSLYTLSIRVGLTYEGGAWRKHFEGAKKYLGQNDNGYTNSAKKGLDKILGKKPEKVFGSTMMKNYPSNVAIHGLHDRSGIVSFGNNYVDHTVKQSWGGK